MKYTKMSLEQIIDTSQYPIQDLDSTLGQELIADCKVKIDSDGALVLPGFILQPCMDTMLNEAIALKPQGHRMVGEFTPYSDNLSEGDNVTLPESHPSRMRLPASHQFVAGDCIPTTSPITALYQSSDFQHFIRQVLGLPAIHPLADPLGCMNLLTYEPGDCNGWHFDTTEFVISILLQAAQEQGDYQYIPALRSLEHENLEAITHRMQHPDDPEGCQNIELTPGSLFLFKGEFTLHRVTEIRGNQDRIVVILSYHRDPGHLISEGSRIAMYGRSC